jgi:hypothetical protein
VYDKLKQKRKKKKKKCVFVEKDKTVEDDNDNDDGSVDLEKELHHGAAVNERSSPIYVCTAVERADTNLDIGR